MTIRALFTVHALRPLRVLQRIGFDRNGVMHRPISKRSALYQAE